MMNEVYLEGRKERIINDTSACFDKVKKIIETEIAKGNTVEEAIEKVKNSASIKKFCPQLKQEDVSRMVFNLIRRGYYNRDKEKQEDKNKEIEL